MIELPPLPKLWVPPKPAIVRAASLKDIEATFPFPMFIPRVSVGGNDAFTKLLLHCDGANNSTTFTDSSSVARTMTAAGNAKISTTQSKYGGAAGSFDGTNSKVTTPSSADLIPSGDYTIDFWLYMNSTASTQGLVAKAPSATFAGPYFIRIDSGTPGTVKFFSSSNGTTFDIANGQVIGSVSATTWTHVEIGRSGNTYYPFINGVLGSTFTSSATPYTGTDQLLVGAFPDSTSWLNGYKDELRISIGTCRHTANFTPVGPYS